MDTSKTSQALFKYFNSISLLLPSDNRIYQFIDRVTQYWIPEYINWHKLMLPVAINKRLPSGFPVLHVKGGSFLYYFDKVKELLVYGQNSGFALSVSLSALDCKENSDIFSELCNKGIIKYLHISVTRNISDDFIDSFILELIEQPHSYHLTLSLPLEKITSKVFYAAGGQNIQIIVNECDKYNKNILTNENLTTMITSSCVPYFVISISEDGYIFPCQGLVGIIHSSVGSIYEEFSDTAFLDRETHLDLDVLASSGFTFNLSNTNLKDIRINGKLPVMCNIHRFLLNGN